MTFCAGIELYSALLAYAIYSSILITADFGQRLRCTERLDAAALPFGRLGGSPVPRRAHPLPAQQRRYQAERRLRPPIRPGVPNGYNFEAAILLFCLVCLLKTYLYCSLFLS